MDRGGSWIGCGSGLPGLAAVWPSLHLCRPPTPDDVVVALIASSQCRSHRPVVLPVTVLVMTVIRGSPLSRRGWPLSCQPRNLCCHCGGVHVPPRQALNASGGWEYGG